MNLHPASTLAITLAMALVLLGPGLSYAALSPEQLATVTAEKKKLIDPKRAHDKQLPREQRIAAAGALLKLAHGLPAADRQAVLAELVLQLKTTDDTLKAIVLDALGREPTFKLTSAAHDKELSDLTVEQLKSSNKAVSDAAYAAIGKQIHDGMETGLQKLVDAKTNPPADQAKKLLDAFTKKKLDKFLSDNGAKTKNKAETEEARSLAAGALLTTALHLKGEKKAKMLQPLLDLLVAADPILTVPILKVLRNTSLITLNGDNHEKALSSRVVQLLGSANDPIRDNAIATAGAHHNTGMEGRLLGVLGDRGRPSRAREAAAGILGGWSADAATAPLIEACKAPEPIALRIAASRALGRIRSVAPIGPLIAGLKSPDASLRSTCEESLRAITRNDSLGHTAAEWEAWWAKNKNKPLTRIREESLDETIKRLTDLLEILSKHIADQKIAELNKPTVPHATLLEVLSNNHLTVLFQNHNARVILAALAAQEKRPKAEKEKARAILNRLIAFPASAKVRLGAARALVAISEKGSDRSSVAPLAARIGAEPDPAVREALVEVLRNMVGPADRPATFDLFVKLLRDPNKHIREFTAMALGDLQDPKAVEPLITLLKIAAPPGHPSKPAEPVARVRYYAVESLGKLKAPAGAKPIIALLTVETELGVRQLCLLTLGKIGGADAIAAIGAAIANPAEAYTVRSSAIAAAVKLKLPNLAQTLTALKIDPKEPKKADALLKTVITTLGTLASIEATPSLLALNAHDPATQPEITTAAWHAVLTIAQRDEAKKRYKPLRDTLTPLAATMPEPVKKPLNDLIGRIQKEINQIDIHIKALAVPDQAKAAKAALKTIGSPAVPFLIDRLADPAGPAKTAVEELLKEITGEKALGSDPALWKAWLSKRTP